MDTKQTENMSCLIATSTGWIPDGEYNPFYTGTCGKQHHEDEIGGCTCFEQAKHPFIIQSDSPDEFIVFRDGKPIIAVSLPEQQVQWKLIGRA